MEVFTKKHFLEMPWKNGGGTTTELYRIPTAEKGDFLFRLSMAWVSSEGPFSIFPGTDRILLLLDGHGLELDRENKDVTLLKDKLVPFQFMGEERINCRLKLGPCRDFNIMTKRSYGHSQVSVFHSLEKSSMTIKAGTDMKFIFDSSEETLYKMEKHEVLTLSTKRDSTLITIDVTCG